MLLLEQHFSAAAILEGMDGELETIYRGETTTVGEVEATGVKSILEANGIDCVVVGDSVLPNLGFEVRVASDRADEARRVLAEALAIGPAGAEEGERESEGSEV
jgi:hypothetical protein